MHKKGRASSSLPSVSKCLSETFLYTISAYGIKIFVQNRFSELKNKLNYKLKFLSISSFKALLHTKNTIMLLSIAAKKMTKFIIVLGR